MHKHGELSPDSEEEYIDEYGVAKKKKKGLGTKIKELFTGHKAV